MWDVVAQALLSKEVDYTHVSLLVIDEEQRFGVAQKESITNLKSKVDVLTMSATPIPRTMHRAFAGFRDTSQITTPPPQRRPIQTHVSPSEDSLIQEVVQRELDRDGQVFFVVPRVGMIPDAVDKLARLLPDASVMSAHGRLSGKQQEEVMETFSSGDCQVLVCTTIVEAGLDLPRVNTIIVENVQMFGLATLYQLRGRVGRSDLEAYAYMLWPRNATLGEEAMERLRAIQDCCNLGDGFKLAKRDMQIRGVGAIFGLKQSGDVDNVGEDLYLETLYSELRNVERQRLPYVAVKDVEVLIGADVSIPEIFLPDPAERHRLAQTICDGIAEGQMDILNLAAQLEGTYGQLPMSVRMLIQLEMVRQLCSEVGVHKVSIVRALQPYMVMETNLTVVRAPAPPNVVVGLPGAGSGF